MKHAYHIYAVAGHIEFDGIIPIDGKVMSNSGYQVLKNAVKKAMNKKAGFDIGKVIIKNMGYQGSLENLQSDSLFY